jgi:prevent-host-death family protein
MDTAHTMSITEARKHIFELTAKAQTPGVYFTLTEKGTPKAVLISAEEYESMVETIEVERIFPDLDKDISETKEALRTGEYKKWSTIADLEKKWGLPKKVAAVAPKRNHDIHPKNQAQSRKKSR